MPENRDSRITDAMRTAAAHAVARRFRASEHGQLCPYWVAHKRNAPTDLAECNCWILRNAQAYANVALEAAAARDPGPVLDPAASEPSSVGPVIAAYPQWWCRACGNRYADHAAVDLCSCDGDLQAVTLQLVAREA